MIEVSKMQNNNDFWLGGACRAKNHGKDQLVTPIASVGLVFLFLGILSVELVALYFTIMNFMEVKEVMISNNKTRFWSGALWSDLSTI